MKGFRVSKIGVISIIVVAGIAAVPLYLVMSNAVQSSSITCQRCHPAIYASWTASREHPASTSCRQCHAGSPEARSMPPGFLADDPQLNAHCLSCHWEVISSEGVKRKLIKVSHRRHLDEGVGCLECHRHIAHENPSSPGNRPSKKACYPCHVLQIDGSSEDSSCRMCHHIILTTPPQVIPIPMTVVLPLADGQS